jgi:hypothetical protein
LISKSILPPEPLTTLKKQFFPTRSISIKDG